MGSGNWRGGGHVSALFPHDPDVEMTHHQGAENTELRSVHVDKWVGAPVCYTIQLYTVQRSGLHCRCHKEPAGTTQHATQLSVDRRNINRFSVGKMNNLVAPPRWTV